MLLAGDVTAAGVGLRGKGAGTITLSTLPTNATVQQAFLYWATLGKDGTFTNPTLNTYPVAGEVIGKGDDPGWGSHQSYAYRADVTALVSGNGSYYVAELPAAGPTVNDTEGASLVVLYAVPGAPLRQIAISDGLATLTSARLPVARAPLPALWAVDPTNARLTLLVGDGQVTSAATRDFAGLNATLLTSTADAFTGSDGSAWDTKTLDASAALTPGATEAAAVLSTWGDSLVWVAAILSVPEQTYTLTVARDGTGSGTVASDAGGINCGATCSASITAGTTVTLTATADPGSVFTGWSVEGCGGMGTCTVVMSQARNVTAIFQRLDMTPPVIIPTVTPGPNAAGWSNTDVTVSWGVTDPESGIPSSSGCGTTTLTADTTGTTLTCTATNAAGLSNSVSVTVKIDKTPPVIGAVSDVTTTATSPTGAVVTFALPTATDAFDPSPVVTSSPASGSTFPIGTTTITVTAKDATNNISTKTFTVTVTEPSPTPGIMHGEGRLDQGGKRAHYEFRVREKATGADRGHLWFSIRALRPGEREGDRDDRDDRTGHADRFVSTRLTDVVFYDLPGVRPGGRATMDTVVFKGIGRWNGAAGYAFTVTATDAGEPGPGRDSFALTITAPNGTTVVSLSGTITRGNNQSNRVKR